MRNLIENILDLAKLKQVDYADIRIVHRRTEEIGVKNGNVEAFTHDEDSGFGIRVLFQGAWGFASSSKMTKTEMETVFAKALKIARASLKVRGNGVVYPSASERVDQYRTPISIDPFKVPSEKKLNLLLMSDEMMRRNRNVKISEAFMGSYKTEKTFASTEGSYIEQEIVECG
ncbi:MAG: DNA gyrase modulator, partial [Deltaproteobacteria bacterium]|nr:DNA gyrase modulator [Deltaproteobacteria bacterium]